MDRSRYVGWAAATWGTGRFSIRSVAPGEQAILIPLTSTKFKVKAKVYDGEWIVPAYSTAQDTVVPSLQWLSLVVNDPLLAHVRLESCVVNLLLIPDAPVVLSDEGVIRPSLEQMDYLMITRIKEATGCNTGQVKQLRARVRDKYIVQIAGLAAFLVRRYFSNPTETKKAIQLLERCTPDQIRDTIPVRFHAIAVDDRLHRRKIMASLQRCVDIMAEWRL